MTPATVVTGFLGAGKTTLIRDAFQFRPAAERWAVVVNERGAIGIDGALLTAGGVAVREVAGGCVCCTAGVELRVALVSILREVQPDRLFVEPSGIARPDAVIDALRSRGIREVVSPRATLCLIDARRLSDPRLLRSEAFSAQLAAADRVVGTHRGAQEAADRSALAALVERAWPPKAGLDWTDGAFDPAWLDAPPGAPTPFRSAPTGHDPVFGDGRVWPVDVMFDAGRLEDAVQGLVRPGALPEGVDRIKGLFRTTRGWRQLDGTSLALSWTPSGWRGDSRVEILAPAPPRDGWDQIWAAFDQARAG
jgi:G3E family GTPase